MAQGPTSVQTPLSVEERLEIVELAAKYGTLIDDRNWEGLADVFTEDAIYEIVGQLQLAGLGALRTYMANARHPIAHHVTNVIIEIDAEGVRMRSKVVGTLPKAGAGSADYSDRLRRTTQGWRISKRIVTLRRRRPETIERR
jgi:hypothetical protein